MYRQPRVSSLTLPDASAARTEPHIASGRDGGGESRGALQGTGGELPPPPHTHFPHFPIPPQIQATTIIGLGGDSSAVVC
jgi:hypothetical protein